MGETVRAGQTALSRAGQWLKPKELEQMLRIYFLQPWFNCRTGGGRGAVRWSWLTRIRASC
jgi:hypothetical protein